ncbi:MAG: hypothetical protein ACLTXH_02825 [Enterobacter hormaechei]
MTSCDTEFPQRDSDAGVWRRSRSQNKKVFSATPLRQDGELKGYLYIILQGGVNAGGDGLAQSAMEYGAVVDAAGGAVWSAGGVAALVLGDAPG